MKPVAGHGGRIPACRIGGAELWGKPMDAKQLLDTLQLLLEEDLKPETL
jgi:hypothetical protein